MSILTTRRSVLGSLGLAVSANAFGAVNQRIRAACLAAPDTFEELAPMLREIRALGYAGFTTPMRLLQPQSGRMEEWRDQLGQSGLDLAGVRANLPKYAEPDRALEEIARMAMAAHQFGSRTLMVHSPGLAADGKFTAEALDAKAKFLDQAAKRSTESGVLFVYRTQIAEFQNGGAELAGLIAKTDARRVYFDLDLLHGGADAIGVFREHPLRTFAMEAVFADPQFAAHELAAAVRHTHWISWLIENGKTPAEASRAVIRKHFGV